VEYLTLAVANAKSHPISAGGRHETAIAFLTDLEEKLDVAQVQLEIYQILGPHMEDAPEVGQRIQALNTRLFTMTEVRSQLASCNYHPSSCPQLFQEYAVPFDLPNIKLLCLHVSEHRDEAVVRPIWNQIFEESEYSMPSRSFRCLTSCSCSGNAGRVSPKRYHLQAGGVVRPEILSLGMCFPAAYVIYSSCHVGTGV
jgi:hypothetical protein